MKTKCKIKDDSELMELMISGISCHKVQTKGFDHSLKRTDYAYITYTLSQQCRLCHNRIKEGEIRWRKSKLK